MALVNHVWLVFHVLTVVCTALFLLPVPLFGACYAITLMCAAITYVISILSSGVRNIVKRDARCLDCSDCCCVLVCRGHSSAKSTGAGWRLATMPITSCFALRHTRCHPCCVSECALVTLRSHRRCTCSSATALGMLLALSQLLLL